MNSNGNSIVYNSYSVTSQIEKNNENIKKIITSNNKEEKYLLNIKQEIQSKCNNSILNENEKLNDTKFTQF